MCMADITLCLAGLSVQTSAGTMPGPCKSFLSVLLQGTAGAAEMFALAKELTTASQ